MVTPKYTFLPLCKIPMTVERRLKVFPPSKNSSSLPHPDLSQTLYIIKSVFHSSSGSSLILLLLLLFRTSTILTYYTVLNVIHPLMTRTYSKMRRDRAEYCQMHYSECYCAIWRLPKIHCHTLDELKERLDEEVVKY